MGSVFARRRQPREQVSPSRVCTVTARALATPADDKSGKCVSGKYRSRRCCTANTASTAQYKPTAVRPAGINSIFMGKQRSCCCGRIATLHASRSPKSPAASSYRSCDTRRPAYSCWEVASTFGATRAARGLAQGGIAKFAAADSALQLTERPSVQLDQGHFRILFGQIATTAPSRRQTR
jgi:hypothetical protein